jgi:hypothetical protein
VTVAELQLLLNDLGKFLRAAESSRVAGELEEICAKLQPFREYRLRAFADFLVKADEYSRGVLAPKPARSRARKSKSDPQAIDQACQQLVQLYDRAVEPDVSVELIEAAVATLESLDAPKARLDELARSMGFAQKFRSKADVLKAVRQKIVGRKGAFDRVHA